MLFRVVYLRRGRVIPGLLLFLFVFCTLIAIRQDPQAQARAAMAGEGQGEKTIYLTFDDGPSANTVRLLDILAEKGVKATFFVTGYRCENADEILARMAAEGHTIGLHTYSHVYDKIYASAEAYLADLEAIDELVYETTGVRSTICRFPGGSANSHCPKWMRRQIADALTARGYVWYDWNVVSGDQTATVYPAGTLFDNVLKGAGESDPLFLLFHDAPLCKTTPDAVALLIDYYTERGWQFKAITAGTEPIQFFKAS